MPEIYKVPLILEPQPEGGYTVTSPTLPELITEGGTLDEAMTNVRDALRAVIELYDDLGKPLPPDIHHPATNEAIAFEHLVAGV